MVADGSTRSDKNILSRYIPADYWGNQDMGRLGGKVAIVSGGARGQGATEAKMLAREGAKVVLGDVLDEEGKQVEAQINESGGTATYVHLDVTREDDWRYAVDTTIDRYGKLDILVNNAGILISKGLEDTTVEDWDRIMGINAKRVSWAPSRRFQPCAALVEVRSSTFPPRLV